MYPSLLLNQLTFVSADIRPFCSSSANQPSHAQRKPQDSWYLAKEMKPFIEPGKFYPPHDAALGPDGNLYVAHLDNHRGASRKHADAAPSIAYPLVAPTNRNPSHAICTA